MKTKWIEIVGRKHLFYEYTIKVKALLVKRPDQIFTVSY